MDSIDPVCAFHGKRWSEHEYGRCLYCCLCLTTLTPETCHVLPDGSLEDICNECFAGETAILKSLGIKEEMRPVIRKGALYMVKEWRDKHEG